MPLVYHGLFWGLAIALRAFRSAPTRPVRQKRPAPHDRAWNRPAFP
jgi:hypothetical protein